MRAFSRESLSWRDSYGFVGVLSKPFPLRDAWNDLSGQPSAELIDANLEEYERQLAVFEKFYWDPGRVNGAFPICTLGCALRILLVVSGEQAGHLWLDRRADDNGISPLISNNNLRATFSAWYQEWLDDAHAAPKRIVAVIHSAMRAKQFDSPSKGLGCIRMLSGAVKTQSLGVPVAGPRNHSGVDTPFAIVTHGGEHERAYTRTSAFS